jgi:endo-1,4-beta-xylanase
MKVIGIIFLIGLFFSCDSQNEKTQSLKEAFADRFVIGAALGEREFEDETNQLKLVEREFNSISPENMLKWERFNPEPGVYNFEPVEQYLQFGKDNNMYIVGHVLFWQNQTPDWVFVDSAGSQISRDGLIRRMQDKVYIIADRYGDKIDAWDVVNESILDSGGIRDSPWTNILGDGYIEQGFRIADKLLPKKVELLYNDFNMTLPGKRNAVVAMVKDLRSRGIRIDGIGMQAHWNLESPTIEAIEESIIAFHDAGVQVHITELDIDVLPAVEGMYGDGNGEDLRGKVKPDAQNNPYEQGLPEEVQQQLTKRYSDIFKLFLKHHDKIKRVTFWGVTDKNSWLNNWPIRGRTNYPLLFDKSGKPKPAFYALLGLGRDLEDEF